MGVKVLTRPIQPLPASPYTPFPYRRAQNANQLKRERRSREHRVDKVQPPVPAWLELYEHGAQGRSPQQRGGRTNVGQLCQDARYNVHLCETKVSHSFSGSRETCRGFRKTCRALNAVCCKHYHQSQSFRNQSKRYKSKRWEMVPEVLPLYHVTIRENGQTLGLGRRHTFLKRVAAERSAIQAHETDQREDFSCVVNTLFHLEPRDSPHNARTLHGARQHRTSTLAPRRGCNNKPKPIANAARRHSFSQDPPDDILIGSRPVCVERALHGVSPGFVPGSKNPTGTELHGSRSSAKQAMLKPRRKPLTDTDSDTHCDSSAGPARVQPLPSINLRNTADDRDRGFATIHPLPPRRAATSVRDARLARR